MPYIYKITNKLNGKAQIGKTVSSVEKRQKEHCKDALKERCEKRPLYFAMRKYGVESFFVDVVEEVDDLKLLSERECYWIEYYGTFKYGYNATRGGDGKSYIDHDLVKAYWDEGFSVREISDKIGCDYQYTSHILNGYASHEARSLRGIDRTKKPVKQIDVNTNKVIKIYASIADAERELGCKRNGHISQVCNGRRKTAQGFKWEYVI